MTIIVGGHSEIEDVPAFLASIREIASRHQTVIQSFDAAKIAGEEHLLFAVEKALKSFERGGNTARSLGLEIMLYAAATRQITRALKLGIKPGKKGVAVVVVNGSKTAAQEIETLLNNKNEKTSSRSETNAISYSPEKETEVTGFFNITPQELDAVGPERVPELVLERVALSDILK